MKKRLSKLALLAVAAAFVLAGFPACSDDDEEEPPPPATATLTDVDIPEGGLVLTAGEPKDVTATLRVTNTKFSDAVKALDKDASLESYIAQKKGDTDKVNITSVKVAEQAGDNTMKVTLTLKADADAAAGITGEIKVTLKAPALTAAKDVDVTETISYTVTEASEEKIAKAKLAGDGLTLTSGEASTATATVTLENATFAETITNDSFAAKAGNGVTVTVTAAERKSDTEATLTLSMKAQANAEDGTVSVTIKAVALAERDDDLTAEGTIGYTVIEPGEMAAGLTCTIGELTAGEAKEAAATVTITNGTFAAAITKDNFTAKASDGKVTVTVKEATKKSDTEAALTLSITAAEGAQDGTVSVTVNKAALTNSAKDLTTPTTAYTVKEKPVVPAEKTLSSITVNTNPTKVAYTVGEDFDPTGLVITATYSDGSTDNIKYNATDFTFDGFNSEAANENVTVTVKYKEKTATFTVSVKEAEKSLFETLSAQENNLIAEDFGTTTNVETFVGVFGKKGVYAGIELEKTGDVVASVSSGALVVGGSSSKVNQAGYIDFGPVAGVVEGCFDVTFNDESSSSTFNSIGFYNGDNCVLKATANAKGNFSYTLNGAAVSAENNVESKKDTLYTFHYKFDLAAKTLTLKINGKAVFTEKESDIGAISGVAIITSNSGKRPNTIDNIAVCGTEGKLNDYKAQVKTWLATLVANSYSEEKGYTTNKSAVDAAKSAGDSAIDAATDVDTVLAAYGNAKDALKAILNDTDQTALDTAKTGAKAELAELYPENNYKDDNLKQVQDAINTANAAIDNAKSVADVQTALAAAKKTLDAIEANNAAKVTVTIHYSETTATLEVIQGQKITAEEVAAKVAVPEGKRISGYVKTESGAVGTDDFDFTTAISTAVNIYVVFEDKPATTTYTLDVSTAAFAEDKSTVIDGMKFEISTSKAVPDSQSNEQGTKIPVINLNGGLKTTDNYIKFTTKQTASVTVKFFHNKDDRYIKIMNAASSVEKEGTEKTTANKAVKETTFTNLPADTYYLGSASSGIYIATVTVTTE